ncbi:MAG: hypothetical protein Q8Q23_00625 [bacterium]|nr:hypothetical protein [bacterium]
MLCDSVEEVKRTFYPITDDDVIELVIESVEARRQEQQDDIVSSMLSGC